ncbi:MAG: outer membrane beta-barrel protein [Saprospiraceae bacterium]|nr:outer membrane beta-barrel protein [Saprospiraceae bacterium]HPK09782.1 outer membrane beta-barrel protein [Saprospiraceae bacterium]
MKRVLFNLCLILVASIGHSQEQVIEKKLVLGASVSFSHQNNTNNSYISFVTHPTVIYSSYDELKNNYISLNSYIGAELNDRCIVGLDVGFSFQNLKRKYTNSLSSPVSDVYLIDRNTTLGIKAFTRYTLNPTDKFRVFAQPYLQYAYDNDQQTSDGELTYKSHTNIFEIGVSTGLQYVINDQWRLMLRSGGLYFNAGKVVNDLEEENRNFNSYGISLSLRSLGLGVEFRF